MIKSELKLVESEAKKENSYPMLKIYEDEDGYESIALFQSHYIGIIVWDNAKKQYSHIGSIVQREEVDSYHKLAKSRKVILKNA